MERAFLAGHTTFYTVTIARLQDKIPFVPNLMTKISVKNAIWDMTWIQTLFARSLEMKQTIARIPLHSVSSF